MGIALKPTTLLYYQYTDIIRMNRVKILSVDKEIKRE